MSPVENLEGEKADESMQNFGGLKMMPADRAGISENSGPENLFLWA
jgi:hypothetical protein